jgi:hypothetical protein
LKLPISVALPIPETTDLIVLCDPNGVVGVPENVVRCTATGEIVWTATREFGVYVGVEWKDGALSADTWDGYRLTLNPETGHVRSKQFTK